MRVNPDSDYNIAFTQKKTNGRYKKNGNVKKIGIRNCFQIASDALFFRKFPHNLKNRSIGCSPHFSHKSAEIFTIFSDFLFCQLAYHIIYMILWR